MENPAFACKDLRDILSDMTLKASALQQTGIFCQLWSDNSCHLIGQCNILCEIFLIYYASIASILPVKKRFI
jgi:hypothetical protein